MRTREREGRVDIPYSHVTTTVGSSGSNTTTTSGTKSVKTTTESMTDVIGNKTLFNPCDHVKTWLTKNGATFSSAWFDDQGHGSETVYNDCLACGPGVVPSGDPYVDLGELASELILDITRGTQGPLQIVETLSDLMSTVRMLRNPFNILSPKTWSKIRNWRRFTKYLAGSHLEAIYGWRPFLNDIRAVAEMETKIPEMVDRLIEGDGKVHSRRRTARYAEEGDDTPDTPDSPSWGLYTQLGIQGVATATVKYRYRLNGSAADLRRFVMAQYLGINQLARAVWAAVPYSFVVDWFADTDLYISNALDAVSMNPPWSLEILDSGISTKTESGQARYVALWNTHGDGGTVAEPTLVQECRATRYTRTAGLPSLAMEEALNLNGLGVSQQMSGGSMIIQKIL